MATRTIPREQWMAFFNDFTKQHQGATVTVEVTGSGQGRALARNLPFAGISASTKDNESTVTVTAGDLSGDHITHIIPTATAVKVDEGQGGQGTTLEIASSDEGTTRVSLQGGSSQGQGQSGAQAQHDSAQGGTSQQRTSQGPGGSSQPQGQGAAQDQRRESGLPGGGQGRTDDVGQIGGVYPASAQRQPSGDAPAQPMASFGQGERGAAGYQDHGQSEVRTIPPEQGSGR